MQRQIPVDRMQTLSSDWNLSDKEVAARTIQYGSNNIIGVRSNKWRELVLETIKDPMIWFLVTTGILFAVLKNYNQALILLLATIPLIVMDAFLHWRTEVSTRSLSNQLTTSAFVIRNNQIIKLASEEIVPGDLVVIKPGTPFPADGIIVQGQDLQVDESALTGESFPVKKNPLNAFPMGIANPLIAGQHWGFAGTRLLTGQQALLRVIYTGQETLYGEIVASALFGLHERTPLQKVIAKLVFYLIGIATLVCIILALVRLYQGFGFLDAILSAATLAVAALPDEFPVVFTFFLGLGVYRLAQKKALVRRAVSVENIGRITCICSDKTGTITEGRFRLTQYEPALGVDYQQLLYLAIIASRTETQDPLDAAICSEMDKLQLPIPKRLMTFPFTEDRKRETSVVLCEDRMLFATKGSPEIILALSNLSTAEKQSWLKRAARFAASGYKIIACAEYLTDVAEPIIEAATNYQFVGLLLFSDPPRPAVPAAVQRCLESGIHILMVTGDHPETGRYIANLIGLGKGQPKVVLAKEAESAWKKDDRFLQTVDVIARAIPSQKLSIVSALQKGGEIVAVTGDGVNDVPALKKADIGIAMGEHGTQSAREVADIVLLDDNFSSIVNAIAEGRQLFKNLLSSYLYLLMIHMPFVISAAVIPLLGFPILYYPIHIVWIELIIHPTSMLVFQDLPAQGRLAPVSRQSRVRFFSSRDRLRLGVTGLFTTALVIFSYIYILKTTHQVELARGFVLVSLSFMSAAITVGLTNLQTRISRIVVAATCIFSILFIQIPQLAQFLALSSLSLKHWVVIIVAGIITLLLTKIF
ncbi:MAG TPA: cation-transporting P-type ATPase [Gammaproteobacteria bacterium]|nr:cation-transporting P-type ATPase [Gammaproteobacteria bacterium]